MTEILFKFGRRFPSKVPVDSESKQFNLSFAVDWPGSISQVSPGIFRLPMSCGGM